VAFPFVGSHRHGCYAASVPEPGNSRDPNLDELRKEVERIGRGSGSPRARARLVEALSNKWQGVQVAAGQVLGRWGGRESVDALRTWWERSWEQKHWWAVRKAAVKALIQCPLEAEDAGWVLDAYFRVFGVAQHEVRKLVAGLPPESAQPRLQLEARSAIENHRVAAAIALGLLRGAGCEASLRALLEDPSAAVRDAARIQLEQLS
jgi:HEAT repeat protein